MPVAEDLTAPPRERTLNPLIDGIGSSARAHEHRLLSAARPALPFLNWLGQFAKPLFRVPRLGWITADPLTARTKFELEFRGANRARTKFEAEFGVRGTSS